MATKFTLTGNSADISNVAQVTRHCGFCLDIITVIKLCGGCKKRAYCSKKCQVLDWKDTGTGQRHKNWCGVYDYGEEDVDWAIVPVPNKGFGIVAKKLLPAGYRIIIEPAFTSPGEHPAFKKDPTGPNVRPMFFKGSASRDGGKVLIAPRTSRWVNHSCLPNAGVKYDGETRVEILFAQQEIQPGEEVTVCYYTHFKNLGPSTMSDDEDQSSANPFEDDVAAIQAIMKKDWGFTCPKDCFCRDRKTRKLILKGKQLFNEMHVSTAIGRFEDALNAGDKLLEIHDHLNVSWVLKMGLLLYLCKIHIDGPEGMSKNASYFAEYHEILRVISPFSEVTAAFGDWLKVIETKVGAIHY